MDKSTSVSSAISSMMEKHKKNSPKPGVNLVGIAKKLSAKKKADGKGGIGNAIMKGADWVSKKSGAGDLTNYIGSKLSGSNDGPSGKDALKSAANLGLTLASITGVGKLGSVAIKAMAKKNLLKKLVVKGAVPEAAEGSYGMVAKRTPYRYMNKGIPKDMGIKKYFKPGDVLNPEIPKGTAKFKMSPRRELYSNQELSRMK